MQSCSVLRVVFLFAFLQFFLFYFILFYFVLFCFVLICFVLLYFVSFCCFFCERRWTLLKDHQLIFEILSFGEEKGIASKIIKKTFRPLFLLLLLLFLLWLWNSLPNFNILHKVSQSPLHPLPLFRFGPHTIIFLEDSVDSFPVFFKLF